MDRTYFYNAISFCGSMDYKTIRLLIDYIVFKNDSVRFVLYDAISVNGKLSVDYWVYLLDNAIWLKEGTMSKDLAISIVKKRCKFTKNELVEILESIEFIEGYPPTYLMDGSLILIDN